MVTATRFTEVCTTHGEGPMWDAASARLVFVDMLEGVVVTADLDGAVEQHPISEVAAAIRPRASGGFVLATEHGFQLLDAEFGLAGEPVEALDDPLIRMNDGGCDPQGRFYCGTMAYAETPGAGTLYRFDPDRSVHEVLPGATISNGLQWSADGSTAFYIDTPTSRIDRMEFDASTGTFGRREPFVTFEPGIGFPDGCAIDVEGGIWVALFDGAAVHRYDADGSLTEVVEVPASDTTACAFGGPDLSTLYITTSSKRLGEDAEPEAGAVFAHDTGIAGAPLHRFAG